jgi:hypothetical protein
MPSRRKSHCHPRSASEPSSFSSQTPIGLPTVAANGIAIMKRESARARSGAGNHRLR